MLLAHRIRIDPTERQRSYGAGLKQPYQGAAGGRTTAGLVLTADVACPE